MTGVALEAKEMLAQTGSFNRGLSAAQALANVNNETISQPCRPPTELCSAERQSKNHQTRTERETTGWAAASVLTSGRTIATKTKTLLETKRLCSFEITVSLDCCFKWHTPSVRRPQSPACVHCTTGACTRTATWPCRKTDPYPVRCRH